MDPSTREKISKSIIWAIRKTGYAAFNGSRAKCPIVSGRLKSSSKDTILPKGYQLKYGAEYASFVERGTKAGIRHVRSYYRRDGAFVKSHSYYSRGQRAQKFIGKSMDESFKGPTFSNNLTETLKMNFKSVKKV
jgi:hypothetical protein